MQNLFDLFSIVAAGGYDLVFEPVIETTKETLERAAEFDRSILTFGCSPDINVYEENQHSYRGDASNIFYRFAGGHIHIGVEEKIENKLDLLKKIEARAGLLINSFADSKAEKLRRNYYGRAGTCRVKSYGIEWRTPSAAILKEVNSQINFNNLLNILDLQIKGKIKPLDLKDEEVQQIINSGEVVEEAWVY